MPAHSASLFSVALAFSFAAPPAPLELEIAFRPCALEFHVSGPVQPFVGVLIGSLSPDLVHYVEGLPPLLGDAVVLHVGEGLPRQGYTAVVRESLFPAGIFVYVQGIVIDETGIRVTEVGEFVLDGSDCSSPNASEPGGVVDGDVVDGDVGDAR